MTNLFLAQITLVIGALELALAAAWLATRRRHPYVMWFSTLLILFALLNGLDALATFFPAARFVLAHLYGIVTPLLPFPFVGGVLALLRPAAMHPHGRGGRGLLRLATLQLSLVTANVLFNLGVYFDRTPEQPERLASYLAGTLPLFPIVALTWLLPTAALLLGIVRRWNPALRREQIIVFGSLLAALLVQTTLRGVNAQSSTELFAAFTLAIGFLLLLLGDLPLVPARLERVALRWSIPSKLGRALGTVVALTALVGLISILALAEVNNTVQETLSTQNRLAQEASTLLNSYRAARHHEEAFALQARMEGVQAARATHYTSWQENVGQMAALLQTLRREPLTQAQQAEQRRLTELFQAYTTRAESYFEALAQRGDGQQGALAEWIAASERLDQLLASNSVATRDFHSRLATLRNDQLLYLATEAPDLGHHVRTLYDQQLQHPVLLAPTTPQPDRIAVQAQLAHEASAFDRVRTTTERLRLLDLELEATATELDNHLLTFKEQVNRAFEGGVVRINERQVLATALILGGLAFSFLVASLLAQVVAQQITRPVLALARAAEEMGSGQQRVRAEVLSQDEIGVAASAFNRMTETLDGLLFTLEERVARRTAQLETAAQVAARVSTMRELEPLLDATTALLVERFPDIYHAQVFLVDEQGEGQWAVLRASTGAVGQKLLARQHRLQVGSQSVIGQVTATGQHLLARAYDPYSVHRPNDLLPNTKSELALPIRRGERVIGALDVQSTRPYAFNEDDVAVLQTLADQLAIAVENARLFRDLGATLQEMERLFTASSRIASASVPEEILDALVAVAESLRQVDRLTIFFFDQFDAAGRPLGVRAARSWTLDAGSVEGTNRFDLSLVRDGWWQALEQDFLEVPDVAAFAPQDEGLFHLFRSLGTASVVVVPLRAAQSHLGVMVLQRRTRGPFPEAVTRVFRVLAQQAAVALNRFALMDGLASRVDELQQLRESFLDLSSSPSLEALLRTMAVRAAALVGAAAAAIYLYDAERDRMMLVALHNLEEKLLDSHLPRGVGVAGHLINNSHPFAVENLAQWPGASGPTLPNERYGAVAAVPLLWQGRLLGALTTINLREQRRFNDDDLRRLALFADQAAPALENSRLLRATERSLRETETLYQITHALMSATSEREMLDAIVSNLARDSEDVVLVVRPVEREEPAMLEVVAVNDAEWTVRTAPERRTRHASALFPLGERLPGSLLAPTDGALAAATTRVVDNLPASNEAAAAQLAVTHGFRSLLAAPIKSSTDFYGAILLLRRGSLPFEGVEVTRVTTVASQFAVAFDNVTLLRESQRAADQLATAAQVSRAASARLDVSEVLTRAVKLIQQQFDYYHVQVFLVDEERLWAELRASTGEAGRQLLARHHRLGVGSRSVIGQVTARGEHVVARSAEVDPHSVHRRNELLPDTRTELALPMKIGAEVIGALDVQSVEPLAFSDGREVDLLQTLADQLAVAVQNARLFERTQQSLLGSQALYQAGRAILEADTPERILRAILEHVAPPDTSELSIFSVGTAGDGMPIHLQVEASLLPQQRGQKRVGRLHPIAPEQQFIIEVLRDARESLAIHDVASDTRLDPLTRAMFARQQIGALIIAPLAGLQGQPRFLQASLPKARHLSQSEVERFGTIAAQASSAIQNLALLDTLEARARRLAAVNELSSRLVAMTELGDLLDLAAREICAITEVDQVGIAFLDRRGGIGQVVAQFRQDGAAMGKDATFPIAGNASLQWLETHRRPLAVSNVAAEPLLAEVHEMLANHEVQSILLLPLFSRNELIGTVGLDVVGQERNWTQEDIFLAQTLSNLVTSAIESTRLFEQVRHTLEQTQALYRASRAINEAESLEALLGALVPLAEPLGPDQVVLLLFNEPVLEGGQPTSFTAVAGLNLRDELIPLGQSYRVRDFPLFGRLPVSSSLRYEDVQRAEGVSAAERQTLRHLRLRALLYLPLRIGARYLGWIGFNAAGPRTLDEASVRPLQTIAQQVATALQSQRLFQEAQRRAWREEQIARITARLHSSTDPEEIMRIGLQELRHTLHVKRAAAWVQPGSAGQHPAQPPASLLNGNDPS